MASDQVPSMDQTHSLLAIDDGQVHQTVMTLRAMGLQKIRQMMTRTAEATQSMKSPELRLSQGSQKQTLLQLSLFHPLPRDQPGPFEQCLNTRLPFRKA